MTATRRARRRDPFRVACGIAGFAILVFVIIVTISNGLLSSQAHLRLGSSSEPGIPGWKLVFDDEFNGNHLNSSVWNVADDTYHGCCLTFGLQYFTADAISLRRGILTIASERKNMDGKYYTSGVLSTENKVSFRYGLFDIRARIPRGQGMWPAFWLTSGNVGQEIDIMEMVSDSTTIYQTYHLNEPKYNTYIYQCSVNEPDLSTAFHSYAAVWNATSVTWYIDGVQTCQLTSHVPQIPMFLTIDTAVGGTWPGPPDDTTVFPQYTLVDYVRVYRSVS